MRKWAAEGAAATQRRRLGALLFQTCPRIGLHDLHKAGTPCWSSCGAGGAPGTRPGAPGPNWRSTTRPATRVGEQPSSQCSKQRVALGLGVQQSGGDGGGDDAKSRLQVLALTERQHSSPPAAALRICTELAALPGLQHQHQPATLHFPHACRLPRQRPRAAGGCVPPLPAGGAGCPLDARAVRDVVGAGDCTGLTRPAAAAGGLEWEECPPAFPPMPARLTSAHPRLQPALHTSSPTPACAALSRFWKLKPVKHSVHIPW